MGLNTDKNLDVAGEAKKTAAFLAACGESSADLDYFFGHPQELAAAHVLGAVFGAGAGDQTLPETDGGNLVAKMKAYVAAGGAPLGP